MNRGPHLAIGNRDVELWVTDLEFHDTGRISFYVINGAWSGSLLDGSVYVNQTKTSFPGDILWEGRAPFGHERYNEAIAWITEQIGSDLFYNQST